MIIRIDHDAWHPDQRADHRSGDKLTPGQIIIWERKPFRVIETRERDPFDWDDTIRDTWTDHGCPDPATWAYRPLVLVLRDENEPTAKPLHLSGSASIMWRTLPEHYAVCRLCGELPPCREVHNEKIAEQAGEHFERQMAIMPGSCHGCREPITSRQKYHRFDGPNLIRPDLGDGSAMFHLRGSCRLDLRQYDKRWADAVPGRRRGFYCEGHLSHHFDDSKTCTDVDCPSVDVEHRYAEWHRPGVHALWMGCWCVSGDLTAQLERDFGAGERS